MREVELLAHQYNQSCIATADFSDLFSAIWRKRLDHCSGWPHAGIRGERIRCRRDRSHNGRLLELSAAPHTLLAIGVRGQNHVPRELIPRYRGVNYWATPSRADCGSLCLQGDLCLDEEDGDDVEQEFEYESNLRLPQAALIHSLASGRFHFQSRFRRFMGDVMLQDAIPVDVIERLGEQSFVFIDSSIRPVGVDKWQTYSYPISLIRNAPTHPHGAHDEPPEAS